eukprot:TRINITY_DN19020_c0_g1_i1.p1 TRINITY_DN19020_c0_g1~~TRINITY_DN19020_c0_g1_i1.p1  ORF type:complete len:134 (-),score=20.21 TRINITY_DN19020_c0_g1_i1:37-438(-)
MCIRDRRMKLYPLFLGVLLVVVCECARHSDWVERVDHAAAKSLERVREQKKLKAHPSKWDEIVDYTLAKNAKKPKSNLVLDKHLSVPINEMSHNQMLKELMEKVRVERHSPRKANNVLQDAFKMNKDSKKQKQ